MNSLVKLRVFAISLAIIMATSGMSGSLLTPPEGPLMNSNTTTRTDLGNGTYVDVTVDGNLTTLQFSDNSMMVINASEDVTTMEIYENATGVMFTRFIIESQVPMVTLPSDFLPITDSVTRITVQEVNSATGEIPIELVQLSLISEDPTDISATSFSGYSNTNGSFYFNFLYAWNQTGGSGELSVGSTPEGNDTMFSFNYFPDIARPFGPFKAVLTDTGAGYTKTDTILTQTSSSASPDSFFDVFTDIYEGGGTQSHRMQGATDGGKGFGSFFNYNNISSGYTNGTGVEPGAPPVAERYPAPIFDNSTKLFEFVDVVITSSSVEYLFETFSVTLFVDKMVLNYYTFTGYYIPIVIYYETFQIHIVIESITVIIYLQVVELVMVIIVYELVKIEVYLTYLVILIEVLEITIIEIFIWFIDVTVVIDISITINIFIINIRVTVKWVIILPIWIWIIPVFIPVFIPIFIPAPTPVPYILPETDVDLVEQTFIEPDNKMNLTYLVTDEYGNPISGANVTVWVDNGVTAKQYTTVEDPARIGYYELIEADLERDAYINVTANTNSLRPIGFLEYNQSEVSNLPSTTTVTVPSVSTTTVTSTLPSSSNSSTTGTSTLPLNFVWMVGAFITSSVLTMVIRKKRKGIGH